MHTVTRDSFGLFANRQEHIRISSKAFSIEELLAHLVFLE
jgi:hypothetical protein